MDIFFKNDGSYGQSAVGIPVLVDYTPVGFVREVNADMVTCSLFDKFIGKENRTYALYISIRNDGGV